MKKILAVVLLMLVMFTTNLSASADVKYSPNTVKKLGTQGKLPKTAGYVGMTYGDLKKQVPGRLDVGEAGAVYSAKNSTTDYLFLKTSVNKKSKVYLISRTFKQTSFTKSLTAAVMKKNFNGKSKVGTSSYMNGQAIYKPIYKTNNSNYIMHNVGSGGIVTLTVGTKKNLQYSGWWLNN